MDTFAMCCLLFVNLQMCNKNLDFKIILHFIHPTTRGSHMRLERVIAWLWSRDWRWISGQDFDLLSEKSSLSVKMWRREVRTALPAWLVEDSVDETWRTVEMLLCLESQRWLVPIFVAHLQRSEATAGKRNSSGFRPAICSSWHQFKSFWCPVVDALAHLCSISTWRPREAEEDLRSSTNLKLLERNNCSRFKWSKH